LTSAHKKRTTDEKIIFPKLYSSTKVEAEGVTASQQPDGVPAVQTHGLPSHKILFPFYCKNVRAPWM